jgi:calcium-dependent protein kinase
MSKLQYATMMCLVTQKMSKQEKQELEKIFIALDTNCDGRLSKDELINGYKKLNYTEENAQKEVEALLSKFESDSSGSIEYSGISHLNLIC